MSSRTDQLEAEIAQQREELAATVNELTAQVQVRALSTAKKAAVAAGVAAVVIVTWKIVQRSRS